MHIPSLKELVSAEEWQARVELAAGYRLPAGCRLWHETSCVNPPLV